MNPKSLLAFSLLLLTLCMGCAKRQQQQVVTAAAVAVVAADAALAEAFDASAEAVADEVEEQGLEGEEAFQEWCSQMRAIHETLSRIECSVQALADLVLGGQALLDASGSGGVADAGWGAWLGSAGSLVAALIAAWTAVEDPPAELAGLWSVLSPLIPDDAASTLTSCTPAPLPGCGVSP